MNASQNIQILVYRVYQFQEQHAIHTCTPYDKMGESRWLVEVNSPPVSQENVPRMSESLFHFASLVSGLVSLVVVDHGCLQNRIQYK